MQRRPRNPRRRCNHCLPSAALWPVLVAARPDQPVVGSNSLRPAALLASPVAPSTPGASAKAQGELPLVRVDPAKSVPAKPDMLLASRPAILVRQPPSDCEYWKEIGERPGDVGLLLEDLGWIANLRSLRLNGVAVLAMGLRSMGGQHWRGIAADARLTSGCTRTELSRSLLPRDFDRRKFGPSWDAECAFATLEFSGYELAEDEQGRFFWRHRRDRRNVHCSRKQREEIGAEDGCERREISADYAADAGRSRGASGKERHLVRGCVRENGPRRRHGRVAKVADPSLCCSPLGAAGERRPGTRA